MFTTKFNRNHNPENPSDAKQPEQLKVFYNRVSDDIFKMFYNIFIHPTEDST